MFHGMTTTNNFTDKISNEEAAALPAIEFRGEIRIVDNEHTKNILVENTSDIIRFQSCIRAES